MASNTNIAFLPVDRVVSYYFWSANRYDVRHDEALGIQIKKVCILSLLGVTKNLIHDAFEALKTSRTALTYFSYRDNFTPFPSITEDRCS